MRDTSVAEVRRVLALIGANNSGKSAIIQALASLTMIPSGNSPHLVFLTGGAAIDDWFEDVTTDHGRLPFEVEVELELSTSDRQAMQKADTGIVFGAEGFGDRTAITFEVGSRGPGSVSLKRAMWSHRAKQFPYAGRDENGSVWQVDPGSVPAYGDREFVVGKDGAPIGFQMVGLGASPVDLRTLRGDSELLHQVSGWIDGIRWLGPERSFATAVSMQTPARRHPTELPRAVQHLYNNDRRTFDSVERQLAQLIPGTERILAPINEQNQTTSVRVSSRHVEWALIHGGHGVSALLSLLIELNTAPEGGLVLLEEPETGLHPEAQRALSQLLGTVSLERELQVIVTTHSPIFARDTEAFGTVMVTLQNDDGVYGTKTISMRQADLKSIKFEIGAQNSDLFMANLVIFCEDESTANFLPTALALCGVDAFGEGIQIVPLHGSSTGRIIRLREYLDYLQGNDVKRLVVLDDDEGVRGGLGELVEQGRLSEAEYIVWTVGTAPAEFEDHFRSVDLVEAANSLAKEETGEAKLKSEELERRRSGGVKVSKVLQRYYFEEYAGYTLSKARLATKLATGCADGSITLPVVFEWLAATVRSQLSSDRRT